jgi:hypothetical protein
MGRSPVGVTAGDERPTPAAALAVEAPAWASVRECHPSAHSPPPKISA